ncbi:MAG: neutral/alkaline non-lysosomal ceramidase N-terminal domain-containing protein [Thermoproteota archaeon]
MEIGAAKVDITPGSSVWLGGFAARYKPSEGVHDPLFAKALFLSSSESEVLLVSCDLLNIPEEIYSATSEKISSETGVDKSAILIAATHTHSGPSLSPNISSSNNHENKSNNAYYRSLSGLIAEAGIRAVEKSKKGYIGFGSTELNISFNRRKKDGPIDPELIVLFAADYDNNPIAVLVNYACHGVVLGPSNYQISSDFMGCATRTIESLIKDKVVSLFFNGADGDLNPITCKGYTCNGTFDDVERLGLALSDKAIDAIQKITLLDNVKIGHTFKKISVDLEKPSLEVAEKMYKDQENYIKSFSSSSSPTEAIPSSKIEEATAVLRYLKKNLDKIKTQNFSDKTVINLQAIRIDDYAILALPGEPFVELGLKIKSNSPFKLTSVFSYANGYIGYIAPLASYEEGGYEVMPTYWNRLKKGSGELIAEEGLKLLDSLK